MFSKRILVLIFIVELHFNSMAITCLISAVQRKLIDYDVPCASSIIDDRVYPCCGLLELEKCYAHHHSYAKVIWPFRQQLLKSETAFCDVCHKNCTSPADFVLYQECVHLCLPFFACPICHFTYITCSCLWMHITESHGGPEHSNFFSLIRISETVLLSYHLIM